VINAVSEIEDLTGRRFIRDNAIWYPRAGEDGCDAYVGTSSAGGGLQMMVAGAVKKITAESAERAALGAGAIVMDVLAVDDRRLPHRRVERIRAKRPDMILLAGGTDGGATRQPVEMAQVIAAADARPRFGSGFKLPVVFAGNVDARDEIRRILEGKTSLYVTENIRPTLENENLVAARQKIHDLFLEHVMAQAPGYGKLMTWTTVPLMPTPGAVGLIMQLIAERNGIQVVGVDIGGATTDVFSVFRSDQNDPASEVVFNRTVSANLGMSYSVFNVVAEAGFENIARWVPLDLEEGAIRNRLRNKMVRPTTIPQTLEDLMVEQALCREALRIAFIQHKAMAVGLRGVRRQRMFADIFSQSGDGQTLVDMLGLDMIVGSGGVLSHAPRRSQAALMMIDSFRPEGFTELAVDSVFMMPQLGVLSSVNQQAALDVFEKDCLVRLGWCIAPCGTTREGRPCMRVEIRSGGGTQSLELTAGQLMRVPLEPGAKAHVKVTPAKGHDMGAGPRRPVSREIGGGVVGIVLDARGRPFAPPSERAARAARLDSWNAALDVYPES
jgi:uncharacterized protein (TIGR01319 family)